MVAAARYLPNTTLPTEDVYKRQALYTTNQIQIMKILLPYCSPDSRRGLAVMIKFMEFDYTLRLTPVSYTHLDVYKSQT